MQKTLQDLHISHERNESENIPILVEERWDAFWGIPKLRRLSLLEYLLGVPWALASPLSPHIETSSIFEHFIHTKLNQTFSGGVSEYGNEIPSCTAVTLLYNYKQTLPTVLYRNSMAPSQGGFNKNSNIRK
mgnify:CR=1 FL=1